MNLYKDLLDLSLEKRRGLTFFINGQTVSGVVTKLREEDGLVEAYSQTYDRILIRLDQVDAVAL